MSIQLIALDIDGTLINSKKRLTQNTIDALQAAADGGIHICIATGRPLADFQDLVAQLPMIRYAVICTGTQVVDLHTGADIYRKALTETDLRRLYKMIVPYNAMPEIFDDRDGKVHNRAWDKDHAERFCCESMAAIIKRTHVGEADLDAYVEAYRGVTNKIHIYFGDLSHKKPLWEQLKKEPYMVMESEENDLEIMPCGIDKGVGLEKLAEYLGLQAAEVAALGDGSNDVGMFRWAGLGIAMKNGSDEAKAAADRISDYTNDEDGAAREVWALLKGVCTQ